MKLSHLVKFFVLIGLILSSSLTISYAQDTGGTEQSQQETGVSEQTQPKEEVGVVKQIQSLNVRSYSKKVKAVESFAATGNKRVIPVLEAMKAGLLYYRKVDEQIFIIKKKGSKLELTDAVSGEAAGLAPKSDFKKVRVNTRVRKAITKALGGLKLLSKNPDERLKAAIAVFKGQDASALNTLNEAIKVEKDNAIKQAMIEARASATLSSNLPEKEKIAAIEIIKNKQGPEALNVLKALSLKSEGSLKEAALKAADEVERRLKFLSYFQDIIFGLSLGSVLLLAAIGLAITFGVMGVINMAHGEMVMIGAYTTFVVQGVIAGAMPGLSSYSLLISIPVAFIIAGSIGMLIERSIIRYMYNRPLDTLLATWGVSLILQQAVRSIFGPTNQNVVTPDWLKGEFELIGLSLTYNRIAIIIFALIVFAVLLFILKKTFFGLQMRAVTQNRQMAASMGIPTKWVDSLTFGLGSGIAGIAGVALSQISNVSPNLGQSFIIDSFMVVVFGGVGNLWGTLVGAFSLGVVNKFLEPYAGAIVAKILVLIFIILFIQKRPRGLFAQKGRAVDS